MNERQNWLRGLIAEWGKLSDKKQAELSLGLAVSASRCNREYTFLDYPRKTRKEEDDE